MIQFFTRIPLNINIEIKEDDFSKGIIYFPCVGLIIGLIDALMYVCISKFIGGIIPIVGAILANVFVTGAFHIDGLADTCDGIFSSRGKEDMLNIMRDSRIGTNGTIAVFFDLALKIFLINNLSYIDPLKAIILAPVIGKTITVLLLYKSEYARSDNGLGGLFIGKASLVTVIVSSLLSLILSSVIIDYKVIGIVLITSLVCVLYKKFIYSKIQGMTGDTLGAGNEIAEIIFLFTLVILERNI